HSVGNALCGVPSTKSSIHNQQSACDILTALDEYAADRFPAHLDGERLQKDKDAANVLAIHSAVEQLLAPLTGKPRPLAEWTEPLRAILQSIYGTKPLNRQVNIDRYLLESLELIARALDAVGQLPPALQPTVDIRQACRIILAEIAGETIPPPMGEEQI